mgnify:CR=1 FL=1
MTPQEHERQKVYVAISRERAYQEKQWGTTGHAVGEWLLILESELAEAKQAWVKGDGYWDVLAEVLQVATDAVACLEEHGIMERQETIP